MLADVAEHLRRCTVCATRKMPPQRHKRQLTPHPVEPYKAGAVVDIDVLGPLPVSATGNRFIVVFTDKVTRWPEAFSTPYVTAQAVANLLVYQYLPRFGCPLQIHTDRGSNFVSELLKHVNKLLGISHQVSPPYSPWVQGSVERFNATLAAMLNHSCKGPDWDEVLPLVLFAYRCAECRATGTSPFELLYGFKPRMPLEATLSVAGELHTPADSKTYLDQVKTRIDTALRLARRTEQDYRRSDDNSAAAHAGNIVVNDTVMSYTPGQVSSVSGKFSQDWTGPYTVTDVQGKVLNLRRDVDGKQALAHRQNVKVVSTGPTITPPPARDHESQPSSQQVQQVRQVRQVQQVRPRIVSPTTGRSGGSVGETEVGAPREGEPGIGTPQEGESDPGAPVYFVRAVLKRRAGAGRKPEYLVQWAGYPSSQNSWEPESSFLGGRRNLALQEFFKKHPTRK